MPEPNDAALFRSQRFPVYYPGEAEFLDDAGAASGAVGATATVTITLNTRPHNIIGVRVRNQYDPPAAADVAAFSLLFQRWEDLKRLDCEQDMELTLAQQNVIVRRASQGLIVGKDFTVWHPFACAYPFRGGNNITLLFRRRVPYPLGAQAQQVILPRVQVVLVGEAFVSADIPPGSPPSSE